MSVPYGASTLNRLLRAQLVYVAKEVEDYLGRGDEFALRAGEEGRNPEFTLGKMPHEWGAVDSWAYMRDAMQVAVEMMDGVSEDAGFTDDDVKKFVRDLVKEKWMHLEAFADEVVEFADLGSYHPERG